MKLIRNLIKKYNTKKSILISLTLICIFVLFLILITKTNFMHILGSLYNISELENNIEKVKIGDLVNYEVNGYSDWQVLSIDKNNNTIDVVSRTNVKDIPLLTEEDYEKALDTFQEEANKFTDDKYAIKARSVTRSDLENFTFTEEFWTADKFDTSIGTNYGKVTPSVGEDEYHDFYVTFYIEIEDDNPSQYHIGDIYNLEVADISEWLVVGWGGNRLCLIPKMPVKFEVNKDNISLIDWDYVRNYIYDNYISHINIQMYYNTIGELNWMYEYNDRIRNFYIENGFFELTAANFDKYKDGNREVLRVSGNRFLVDGWYNWEEQESFKNVPATYGFRPVVTLKYSNKLVDNAKEINENLKVGDNVNYQANNYQNWKVLSYDSKNDTVDLISGGIVENLYLYGQDNFDNYESILQEVVDKYKNGDNVISARSVEYSDLSKLNDINDKLNVQYWLNNKKQYNKKVADSETSSPYNKAAFYDLAVMSYNKEKNENERKYVSIYVNTPSGSLDGGLSATINGMGDLSYTAGIRPIITVKASNLKKLAQDELKQVNEQTKQLNNSLSKQHGRNKGQVKAKSDTKTNKDSDTKTNEDSEAKKDNKKSTKNNLESSNYANNGGIVYEKADSKILKYILIAIIALDLIAVVIAVFSILSYKYLRRKIK